MNAATINRNIQKISYRFTTWVWKGIDWVFPPVCAGCGEAHQRFCTSCIQATPKPNSSECVICGQRLPAFGSPHDCSRSIGIDSVLVWGIHAGPLRKALHQFKYKRDIGLAESLASLMVEKLERSCNDVELVVPVPLAPKRQRERGYNQAELLAHAIAGKLGIPFVPSAAKRIRETRSQVGLSIVQRRDNVAGAFWADPRHIDGKCVLLIDDVLTTGATLNACALALRHAGASKIVAMTVARAP